MFDAIVVIHELVALIQFEDLNSSKRTFLFDISSCFSGRRHSKLIVFEMNFLKSFLNSLITLVDKFLLEYHRRKL